MSVHPEHEPAVTKTAPELTNEDALYFDRRAEHQLELAQRAAHPAAVAAHCALADHYMAVRGEAETIAA